jgi:hypothetical protein
MYKNIQMNDTEGANKVGGTERLIPIPNERHSHGISSSVSDPKVFGPGLWFSIHTSALKINQENFLSWIRIIVSSIPCLRCRNHATEYINENPPDVFKDVRDENTKDLIGMFKWAWKFHNDVNLRLKKPLMDYNTVYRMYTDESVMCSEECGN